MSGLKILVVEDDEEWQEVLQELLAEMGPQPEVAVADNYRTALGKIHDKAWDLVTVDLSLEGDDDDGRVHIDESGMLLMSHIRGREDGARCGIVVLTARASPQRVLTSLKQYGADDFVEKVQFNDEAFGLAFLHIARTAVLSARLREATRRASSTYRFVITVNGDALMRTELRGPRMHSVYMPSKPLDLQAADLGRRTDDLNWDVLRGGEGWRPEAQSVGETFYRALGLDSRFVGDFASVRALIEHPADLRFQLEGPSEGLRLPFELLRVDGNYLAFNHVLSRRLTNVQSATSHKSEPFHTFIGALARAHEPLRVLVIGANADGRIPAAETEAVAVAEQLKADAREVGIESKIDVLVGSQASHQAVTRALQDRQLHIVHYAGHGRFEDHLAEVSGLVLRDGATARPLTATELKLLVADTDIRIMFLSCCFGARTGQRSERSDSAGMMDALGQANVPNVLSYRWTVDDKRAKALALQFYSALFRSFSPGEALLEARRGAALDVGGLDDDTWASPILLEQAS